MKILILSSSNPYKTAGVVAKDLLNGFRSTQENKVEVLVKAYARHIDEDIRSIDGCFDHYKKLLFRKIRRLSVMSKIFHDNVPSTDPNYCIHDYNQIISHYSTEKILKKVSFEPDRIIVLFMHNFLSFENLYEINKKTNAPIYLYMMDMAPITGGCHYAWKCERFATNCANCPAFTSSVAEKNDQSRINFEYKKKYIEQTDITPVACTEWQLRQLKKSNLFLTKRKHKVLLPIDKLRYKHDNKMELRKKLYLPQNKKILFFGAVSLTETRKGLKELVNALKILNKKIYDPAQIHLAIAGNNIPELNTLLPFSYTNLGYLDHNKLRKAFQAADVFVSPSIEDSGPMMINQSIMCGTPVVAFEMGVALDLVHNNKTGFKVTLGDCTAFAEGIKKLVVLSECEYKVVANNCRQMGKKECSYDAVSLKWRNIFENV